MSRTRNLAAGCVLLSLAATASAELLSDPTRPMDAVIAPRAAGARVEYYGPVLQSTLVSPQRKSAVISGKRVKIGDVFEGSLIVDISPYEVRMSRAGQETSLRLSPKLAKEKGKVE